MTPLPAMMRGSRFRGAMDMQIEEMPTPRATRGKVILRIKAVGVCPSSVKMLHDPSRIPGSLKDVPGFPGHETAAEVVEVGEGVSHVKIGDRVVPTSGPTCGHCHYCRRGLPRFCQEQDFSSIEMMSFVEYMACSARDLLPIPDSVDDEQASLAEPLGCCVASIQKCSLEPGDDVVVVGAGTMGILHVQLVRAIGARPIVVETDGGRLSFATEIGSCPGVIADEHTPGRIRDLTGGRGATAVIIAAGSAKAIESAFDYVGPGGTVMLFAGTWPPAQLSLDPNLVHYRQINVTGSVGALMVDYERALALMASGAVAVKPLITHRFPLSEVSKAHQTTLDRKGLKVVVVP